MPRHIEELLGKYLLAIGIVATCRPDRSRPMDDRWRERDAAYDAMWDAGEALEKAIYEIDPRPFRKESPYRDLMAVDGWLWQARRAAHRQSINTAADDAAANRKDARAAAC